jgi:hypothetical protein
MPLWRARRLRSSGKDHTNSAAGFAAFISYRQVEPDRRIAQKLHELIETYRPPRGISRPDGQQRPLRTFLDTAEAVAGDLPKQLQEALAASDALIVVCSPRIHDKPWVNDEVDRFIKAKGPARVLPLLIEGTPPASFPPALLKHARTTLRDGLGREQEVVATLGADIRADSLRRSLKQLRTEKLRLIAPLLGVKFEALRDRETERRRARWRRFGIAAVSTAAVAAGLFGISTTNWYQMREAIRVLPQGGEIQGRYRESLLESLIRSGHEDAALALADTSRSESLFDELVRIGARMGHDRDALQWVRGREWLTDRGRAFAALAEELRNGRQYALALEAAEAIPEDWTSPELDFPEPVPPPDIVEAERPDGFGSGPAAPPEEPPPPFPCPPEPVIDPARPLPSAADETSASGKTWDVRYEALSKIGFESTGATRRRALLAAFDTLQRMSESTGRSLDKSIELAIALRTAGADSQARLLTHEAVQAACRSWEDWERLLGNYDGIELMSAYVDAKTMDAALATPIAPPVNRNTAASIAYAQLHLARGDLEGALARLSALLAQPGNVAHVAPLFGARRDAHTTDALLRVMKDAADKLDVRARGEAVEHLLLDLVEMRRFDSVLRAASLLDADARGRALLDVLETAEKDPAKIPPAARRAYARAAIPLLDANRSEVNRNFTQIAGYLMKLGDAGNAQLALERIPLKERFLAWARLYAPVASWLTAEGRVQDARRWLLEWYNDYDVGVLGALSSEDDIAAFRKTLTEVLDATLATEGAATAMQFVDSFKAPNDELPIFLEVGSQSLQKAHQENEARAFATRLAQVRAASQKAADPNPSSDEAAPGALPADRMREQLYALARNGEAARMIDAVSRLECSQRIDALREFWNYGEDPFNDQIRTALAETALYGANGKACETLTADDVERLVDVVGPSRSPVVRKLLWQVADTRQELRPAVAVRLAQAGDFYGARRACNRCSREDSAYLTMLMVLQYYNLADAIGKYD